MLEYRILGPLQVSRDGTEIGVGAPKVRTALLALLLRPNEAVSVDLLVDALWSGRPPASAGKLIQVYVSRLRACLGADAVDTVASGYRLPLAADALDAARFERLHAEAREALAEGNASLALARCRRALALWRGPALTDVAYASFAAGEAARLDDLRIECLEDRLDAELALGRHEAALGELERLSAEHPLRERARQRLALALYRSERQADALRVLADGRLRLRDELGVDPSDEHQRLERAILEHSPDLRVDAHADPRPIALPMPVTPLVGRRADIAQIAAMLERDDIRLVTIAGAGGSGKTRVALEVARSIGHLFANGVVFVELAPLRDPGLVLSTVARQLGMVESAEPTAVGLARRLRTVEMLIVVDNVEHLVDAAPDLAGLLRDTERLTLLATSRRVLHVAGEHVYSLEPLPERDAVQLFTDRMAAAGRASSDDDADGVIGAICRRVDGLPLAVELAAARTTTMPPGLLFARLRDSVAVLGVGPRDAPAHQRTLADTVAWSTELLSDGELRAFARLSVFIGGSTLDAAETVAAADTGTIEGLVDSSLLRRVTTNGVERLMMLETIREHAAARLDRDDRAAAEAAHTAYYLALTGGQAIAGSVALEVLARLDAEIDNVRAAFDRLVAAGDEDTALALAVSVDHYWDVRGRYREGYERIAPLVDRGAGEPALRARALAMLSWLTYRLGEPEAATILATRGIDLATADHSPAAAYECHTMLGLVALDSNELTTARRQLERAHTIAVDLGRDETRALANGNLADLAMASGDNVLARRLWERNLDNGLPPRVELHTRWGLGTIARREGRHDAATDQFTRTYALAESFSYPLYVAVALVGLAAVATDQGNGVHALSLLERADTVLEVAGIELTGIDAATYRNVHRAALAQR